MSDTPEARTGWMNRLGVLLEMIKFQHTLFAMPFAIMSAALATNEHGSIAYSVYFWIVVAMVSARSTAMAFNRLVDQDVDSRNPRTLSWALPSGQLTRQQVWVFTVLCSAVFLFSAYELNPLAFALCPVALLVIMGYSYTKRFTYVSHWVLGLALGIAPMGAWIAINGCFALTPLILSAAVILWTAGFDIIYSLQDLDFDRANGLNSIPVRFGTLRALQISSFLHFLMVLCLAGLFWTAPLGWIYAVGVGAVAVLLVFEHRMIAPDDLSHVDAAFFSTNGLISVGIMVALLLDMAVR